LIERPYHRAARPTAPRRRCGDWIVRTMRSTLGLSAGFACWWGLCGVATAEAGTDCKVVDLMPVFWESLQSSDAAARLRATLVAPYPDLYNENYVNLPSGSKWDATVARARSYAEAHRKEVAAAESYLFERAQPLMAQFRQTFPDFRCDFTFYIAPSFGLMDGSAAFVNGQHRIIFAPDVIPRFHGLSELKVLIDHETFHIYHHQATGRYGASDQAVPTILEALWSEGLATFVSWRMNPGFGLDVALLQPGIAEGARPRRASIAKDLLVHLDDRDQTTFDRYFVSGRQLPGHPPRGGYYVGTLIAQELAARYTLPQLAHLNGSGLRALVAAALQKMAGTSP
jgi:hypothetical protein